MTRFLIATKVRREPQLAMAMSDFDVPFLFFRNQPPQPLKSFHRQQM
jgi:hypothetical protein